MFVCVTDTLGFSVKFKRTSWSSLSGKSVVGGFTVNFKKMQLFETLSWSGRKAIAPSVPFSPEIGAMYVRVSATPQVCVCVCMCVCISVRVCSVGAMYVYVSATLQEFVCVCVCVCGCECVSVCLLECVVGVGNICVRVHSCVCVCV